MCENLIEKEYKNLFFFYIKNGKVTFINKWSLEWIQHIKTAFTDNLAFIEKKNAFKDMRRGGINRNIT